MSLKILFFIGVLISTTITHAGDICQTKYTLLHYAESECVDVEQPLSATSNEIFSIRSVLITKELSLADQKDTVVLVPGGPGDSGEALLLAMQEREVINSMWYSMNVNIVVYDPRGTGMSKLPKDITNYGMDVLSMENLVEDLKQVIIKTARHKPVVLLAHSAGGHTVLRFAEKYPELVKKIILVSTSTSPREMAQLTLGLQAKESLHWNKFIATINDPVRRDYLNNLYLRVEEVIAQQQKARILNQYIHPNLKHISTAQFRNLLVSKLELTPDGSSFIDILEAYNKAFDEMDLAGPLLIPDELKNLKLQKTDFNSIKYHAKEWMIRLFVCGEGLTQQEVMSPLLLDGLTMDYYCEGLFHATNSFDEPHLEQITAPVLFFSGLQDGIVPTSYARETVKRLANAELIVSPNAGHLFFNNEPALFYDKVKEFISTP